MNIIVKEIKSRALKEWWYEEEGIDFSPVYQRKGSIWAPSARQKLIDTVLNGFDIPKVYLADFTRSERSLDASGLPYAVIDGKQRLQTLFSFFSGGLRLSDNFVLLDEPSLEIAGLDYKELSLRYPWIADRFASFRLTVMGVVTDNERYINELFLRLNASSPLTGAEKRNAMLGEVPGLIRQLVAHPFFRHKVSFATLRGQDANAAAKLLLLEHAGSPFDTKKTQLDRLVAEPNWVFANSRGSAGRDRVERAIGGFVDVVDDTENGDISHSAERVRLALDRLAPQFLDNDPLLAAQAQLPIIYLLASSIDDEDLYLLRSFLVRFARDREENRRLEIDDLNKDQELVQFELMNRSSNDQKSIDGRYKILLKRFSRFKDFY